MSDKISTQPKQSKRKEQQDRKGERRPKPRAQSGDGKILPEVG